MKQATSPDNTSTYVLPQLRCLRCGHEWIPRLPTPPKKCPNCISPYWNVEKTRIKVDRARPVGDFWPLRPDLLELLSTKGPMTSAQIAAKLRAPYKTIATTMTRWARLGWVKRKSRVYNPETGRVSILWGLGDRTPYDDQIF